jgi:predicted nucleotidyltransferase
VEEAQREAYRAAHALAKEMGRQDPTLRRVVLFGSTLPGRRYRENSDIDLAVEGGDRAHLERLAASLPQKVDIIGLDDLRPGIRDRVEAEGEVLYEAE